jgi:AcrR family transcriptional regulator
MVIARSEPTGSPAAGQDGRRARAERNKDAVVDAILDLLMEGVTEPTAEAIAARSGVSVRSVFRHFDDLESLYETAVEHHSERVVDLFDPPPSGGPLAARIAELATRRGRLFEEMTPVRRAAERLRGRSPVLEERLRFARGVLRAQLEELFAPELAQYSGSERRDVLDAVELATSWRAWDLLRTEQKCSVARARAVMMRTLTALLAP